VVTHAGRPRGEQRHVDAALALQPQLRTFDGLTDLVVADAQVGAGRALSAAGGWPQSAAGEKR
jgi:hypothetical protein